MDGRPLQHPVDPERLLHLQRVSGSNTVADAITSSRVSVWRNTASGLRAACWRAYKEWATGRAAPAKPQIAILDWGEVPTRSEFELFLQYFNSQGLECRIVDPRHVEYRGGALYSILLISSIAEAVEFE